MEEDQEDFEEEEEEEEEEVEEEEEEEEDEEEEDVDIMEEELEDFEEDEHEEEHVEGEEEHEEGEDVDIVDEEELEDFEEDEHEEEHEEGEDVDIMDEEDLEDFEEDEQEEEHEDGEDVDIVNEEEEEDFEEDEEAEEHEDEEDVDTVDGDEENYEDEETMDLIPAQMTSPILSSFTAQGTTLQRSVAIDRGLDKSNSCEGNQRKRDNGGGDVAKESLNRCEIDGLLCPICFLAWTSNGDHQICCLPCGHIYGLSCINKWLQQTPNSTKCPQCNGLCTLKDVRVLYATNLRVVDEELHKKLHSLVDECAKLNQKYTEHIELTQRVVKEMAHVVSLLADRAAIPIPTWLSESVPTDHDPVDDTPPSTAT